MKYRVLNFLTFLTFSLAGNTQLLPTAVQLPNGWKLTPAGKSFNLGDLPLNMVLNHAGNLVAVTNNGQSTQSIQLVDVASEQIVDELVIQKSWYGLAFSADDSILYAAGGHDNRIMLYKIQHQKLVKYDSISLGKPWPVRIGPAGIAIDEKRKLLYVVTREDKNCT